MTGTPTGILPAIRKMKDFEKGLQISSDWIVFWSRHEYLCIAFLCIGYLWFFIFKKAIGREVAGYGIIIKSSKGRYL